MTILEHLLNIRDINKIKKTLGTKLKSSLNVRDIDETLRSLYIYFMKMVKFKLY